MKPNSVLKALSFTLAATAMPNVWAAADTPPAATTMAQLGHAAVKGALASAPLPGQSVEKIPSYFIWVPGIQQYYSGQYWQAGVACTTVALPLGVVWYTSGSWLLGITVSYLLWWFQLAHGHVAIQWMHTAANHK